MTRQEKQQLKAQKKEQKRLDAEKKREQKALRIEARKQSRLQKKHVNKVLNNAVEQRKKQREQYKNSTAYKLYQLSKQQLGKSNDWYKLDNDALLYPMIANSEGRSNFRISAQLKQPVDPFVLQGAVNDLFRRFPTMTGCLKWGFFWPYVDKPLYPVVVTEQTQLPCRPMNIDNKHSQIRVLYYKNSVAVEFFHSATDGVFQHLVDALFRKARPCRRQNGKLSGIPRQTQI